MERKYGQRGYQESGRDDRDRSRPPQQAPRKPLTPEEKAQLRGLKHAVQREANEVLRCPDCGRNIPAFGAVGFETACPHCNAPLHTCRACRNFDSAARWECRAPLTERVAEKGKPNTCELYEARLVLDATGKRTGPGSGPSGNDPKSQFENLFKR
jgi:predicted RNA-binding Zn-ribbon protein involved in translation (DUF1610 family)